MNKKIFIVEDNPDIREIYRLAFELAGFSVETSDNGLDAVSRIGEIRPDIVLLDLMLPEMSGFDVLKSLKQNFQTEDLKTSLIIVWSNLSQDEDVEKALANGANYYLRKSDYDGDALILKVKEIIKNQPNH